MCRGEAAELHAQKASIEKAGGSLVCLLKGGGMVSSEEVAGFQSQDFWHPDTPLYFDDDLTFFKALGGGKLRKGKFFRALFNPWSTMYKAHVRSRRHQEELRLGRRGLIRAPLRRGARTACSTSTSKDGTAAPIDEVVAATKKAAESVQKA